MMAAAQDTQSVVCMHVGSSSTMPLISSDAPGLANLTFGAVRAAGTMLAWVFSDYFERMPGLKIALSEGNIGWMPYFIERAEQVIDKQRYWASQGEQVYNHRTGTTEYDPTKALDFENFDLRQRFRDHVYGCFIDDFAGLQHIRELGVENVMIETDYPHSDSTWPNSISHAHKQLATTDLTDPEKYLILRGNAERVFQFSPTPISELPTR
jgi:predicted TIM-barrel fold metal-dependent hydrolase